MKILRFFLAFAILCAVSSGKATPQIQGTHEELIKTNADVSQQLPELRDLLLERIDRLARKTRELSGGGIELIPNLYIFDRPDFYARTLPFQAPTIYSLRRFQSNIYLSTGAIRAIWQLRGFSAAEKLEILTAVLAHEIAHAVEFMDAQSPTKTAEKIIASYQMPQFLISLLQNSLPQYREVRADIEAMLIMHSSGFDPRYLHVALSQFGSDQETNPYTAVTSTHPPNPTRLTLIEAAQSAIRQDFGSNQIDQNLKVGGRDFERASMMAIAHRESSIAHRIMNSWQSLDDLYLGLTAHDQDPLLKQQLHIRLLKINQLLAAKGTNADYERFVTVALTLCDRFAPPLCPYKLLEKSEIRASFLYDHHLYSPRIFQMGPLHEYQKQVPVTHRKKLVGALKSYFQSIKSKEEKTRIAESIPLITSLETVKEFDPDWAKSLIQLLAGKAVPTTFNLDPSGRADFSFTSEAVRSRLGSVSGLFDLAWRTTVSETKGAQPQTEPWAQAIPIFQPFLAQRGKQSNRRERLIARLKLAAVARDEEALVMRRMIEFVWKERALFSLYDLSHVQNQIDWEFIMSVLGIDFEVGYQRLVDSVRTLTRSPKYIDALRMLSEIGYAAGAKEFVPRILKLQNAAAWWDNALIDDLAGGSLPPSDRATLLGDKKLVEIATQLRVGGTLMGGEKILSQRYLQVMKQRLAENRIMSAELLIQAHISTLKDLQIHRTNAFAEDKGMDAREQIYGSPDAKPGRYLVSRWIPWFADLFLEAVSDAKVSPRVVREMWQKASSDAQTQDSLLGRYQKHFETEWIDYSDRNRFLRIARKLHALQVIDLGSPLKLIEIHKAKVSHVNSMAYLGPNQRPVYPRVDLHFILLGHLSGSIVDQMSRTLSGLPFSARKQYLNALVEALFAIPDDLPKEAQFALRQTLPKGIDDIRKVVWDRYTELGPTVTEALTLADKLTVVSSSPVTDTIFSWVARNQNIGTLGSNLLAQVLSDRKVSDAELHVRLASIVLEPHLVDLEKSRRTESTDKFFSLIERMIPDKSRARDDYLEDVSWRLALDAQEEFSFTDLMKTSNWRSNPPPIINLLSLIQSLASQMTAAEGEEMTDYVLNLRSSFPEFVQARLTSEARLANAQATNSYFGADTANVVRSASAGQSESLVSAGYVAMDTLMKKLTPEERTGFLLVVLKARKLDPVKSAPALISRYYGFGIGSKEELALSVFVEALPPEERYLGLSFILAYSQGASDGNPQYNRFAEVFKAPGVKLAQLLAIFRTFKEEVTTSLKEAQDNTAGLSRYRLLTIFSRELNSQEYSQIKKPLKKLSSASMKTTFLAELKTSEKVVIAVVDPRAKRQISENIGFMKRYLKLIQVRARHLNPIFLADLIHDLEIMMHEELDLKQESKKMERARAAYLRINHRLKSRLQGWKFDVPTAHPDFTPTETVLVMKFAEGVKFSELDSATQKHVGALFFESYLDLLFNEKLVSPDPHLGNLIINADKKLIHPIDWGQLTPIPTTSLFQRDNLYRLIRLFEAAHQKDVKTIVDILAIELVRKGTIFSSARRLRLERKVREINQSQLPVSEALQQIVHSFSDVGLPLDDFFTIRAIKGLLIMQREGYVSDVEFFAKFNSYARNYLLTEKSLVYAADFLRAKLPLDRSVKPENACTRIVAGP